MGLSFTKEPEENGTETTEYSSIVGSKLHGRQASIRQSTIKAKAKQAMPDPGELERRFTKVLVRMF